MQRIRSSATRFDFDVITDPVEPHPAPKPAPAGSAGHTAPTAGDTQSPATEATKAAG
jgi:hypothetical protein